MIEVEKNVPSCWGVGQYWGPWHGDNAIIVGPFESEEQAREYICSGRSGIDLDIESYACAVFRFSGTGPVHVACIGHEWKWTRSALPRFRNPDMRPEREIAQGWSLERRERSAGYGKR
jgi:hypothetical protein